MPTYSQRKQKCALLNICLNCYKPKGANHLLCDTCMEKDRRRCREKRAKQRAKNKARGVCISCGDQLVDDKTACNKCIKKATNSTLHRYETNKNNDVCPFCGKELNGKFRCDRCHKNHLERGRLRWRHKRKMVLKHYGDECTCCGESEFLEIDHIDNNGAEHRKKTGRHIYEWIIKNDFPPDLQILCANCNRGRAKFGVCPHKHTPKLTKYRQKRLQCIAHYGGRCIYCGESNWAFLEFDHINNDGNKHRKTGYGDLVAWITRNNFPNIIQLLCSNCNKAKGLYGKTPRNRLGGVFWPIIVF